MALVATMSKPVLPMMLVDTLTVDVSTIANAPNAYLVAAMDTVLLSLIAMAADAYLVAATAIVLVSLMVAAPMAYRRPLMAMELVLEIARGVD
jgi:hypothetical protein